MGLAELTALKAKDISAAPCASAGAGACLCWGAVRRKERVRGGLASPAAWGHTAGLPAAPQECHVLGAGGGARAAALTRWPLAACLPVQSSRHSKLEKADILEMTVKHLRNLQRAQMTAALSADPTVLGKYRAGFNECMNEVTRFLSTCEGVNTDVRTRLLSHLSACLGQIVAMNYPPPPPAGQPAHLAQPLHVQLPPAAAGAMPVPCKLNPAEALSPKVYGGFQLVPATDGQFAFLIPNPAFPPNSGPVIPLYANANVPASAGSNTAATPSASPVQGLTSFGGSIVPASQAGSPVGERSESVWRPW
uniref:Hes family bHLH transcription factor 4 n=1 Tax=Dromaius novaehollandiae TaxID=8790 RepID=A0A8C4P8M8_DRONO